MLLSVVSAHASRRRMLRSLGFLLYLFVLAELGAHAYWAIGHGLSFSAELEEWHAHYFPGLRNSGILAAELGSDDGYFDVVLLGGSVLDNLYTNQEDAFRDALRAEVGAPVRLYNLALPAHTTRDSVLKFRLLREKSIDLVVLYHAINDTRMNNCARDMFRDDYTHAAWYHEIARMQAHARLLPYVVLPFTVEHALTQIMGAKGFEFYVRRNTPNHAMTRFGADIKTAEPFRKNLDEIVAATGQAGSLLLVMTFDRYLPDDYSLEAFQAGQLDYDSHSQPTEIWGRPAHVVAGIEAHNDVLRRYANDAPPHVIYLDVEPVVPDGRAYWDDICHFNAVGEMLWIKAMAASVGQRMARDVEEGARP